mgnify:CR=1 FL=1
MMSAQPRFKMTVEEYLEFERNSEEKHEYFDGEVWLLHREPLAMAGAKPNHNLIAANTIAHLSAQVEAKGCRVFTSDQKLRLPSGLYTYPDVTLVCEAPKIGPHADAMRGELARILGIDATRVGVKATTSEGLGFTGREEGIAALATATLVSA